MARRRMIRKLVLEIVDNASGMVEEVKDLVMELIVTAEEEGKFRVLIREIKLRGFEQRVVETLNRDIKEERVKKKQMLEKTWRARMTRVPPDELVDDKMYWEDFEIDFWLDFLNIKEDDEPEDMELEISMEEDWLDEWVKDDMELEEDVAMKITTDLRSLSLSGYLDEEMEITVLEPKPDYMAWLVRELMELEIGEDVLECIRRMNCEGNCDDMCGDTVVEECIKNVHCAGDCNDRCEVETENIENISHGNIMQAAQDSTLAVDMQCVHCPGLCRGACSEIVAVTGISDKFSDPSLSHRSYKDTSKTGSVCVYNVHNVHTNVTNCTVDITLGLTEGPACMDRPVWKSRQVEQGSGVFGVRGAKDESSASWGMVRRQEELSEDRLAYEGVSNNDFELGIKYCPGIEIQLPRYEYIDYKPRYSSKPYIYFRVGPCEEEPEGAG